MLKKQFSKLAGILKIKNAKMSTPKLYNWETQEPPKERYNDSIKFYIFNPCIISIGGS
jgi:hypothetical protein